MYNMHVQYCTVCTHTYLDNVYTHMSSYLVKKHTYIDLCLKSGMDSSGRPTVKSVKCTCNAGQLQATVHTASGIKPTKNMQKELNDRLKKTIIQQVP